MIIIMGSSKSPKMRSKWYKCFKPDVDDYPFKPPVSCLRNNKGGKQNLQLPPDHNPFMNLSDDVDGGRKLEPDSSSSDHDGVDLHPNKKSKPRRGFSRVIKAVLFQPSLAKRKGSRKSDQETSKRPSKFDKLCNSFRDKKLSTSGPNIETLILDDRFRSDSGRSTLFSSTAVSSSLASSRASSIASNSRSASERKRSIGSLDSLRLMNQKPTVCSKKSNGYCVGLYILLLICLVALVFWGKPFAIFCTSTSLFLLPCGRSKRVDEYQSTAVNNNNSIVEFTDVDSEEYKKKVIMEGPLERNNHNSRIL